MLDEMCQHHIDTAHIIVDSHQPTGFSVILSTGADRAILTFPGLIAKLKLGDIDLSLLRQARHLHMASYYLLDDLRSDIPELFRQAREAGLSISMDTNCDPHQRWEDDIHDVLSMVDVLLVNEAEAKGLLHIDDVDIARAKLAERVQTIAIKRGAEGGIAQVGREVFSVDAIPVEVKDTVGAGDSFDAGYIYGYLAGWEPERCLRLAISCGSLSTRAYGGTAAQPNLAEAKQNLLDS